MKLNYFLSFCLLLLLASCSQQKFAFRHTVHVKNNQQKTTDVVEQKHTTTLLNARSMSLPTAVTSLPQKMELSHVREIASSYAVNKPTTLLTDTLKKKYKFDTEVTKPTEGKNGANSSSLGESSQYDSAAVAGFVFGIVGWFYLITAIPGFIYSLKGLKSKKNHGLAVAGLVLSSIFLAILALFIIVIVLIIATYN